MVVVVVEVETENGNLLDGTGVAEEVGMENGNLVDGMVGAAVVVVEEIGGVVESLMKSLGKLHLNRVGARHGAKDGVAVDTNQDIFLQNVSYYEMNFFVPLVRDEMQQTY